MKKESKKSLGVPDMLTVEQLAEKLHIHRASVFRLPLRYTKVGGRRLYFADDVRLMLTLNTVNPHDEHFPASR